MSENEWKPGPGQIKRSGDPTPEPTPEEKAAMVAYGKRWEDLRGARLDILDQWNLLENSLVQLMAVAGQIVDPVVASILYFSPHSFSTRQQIVDRLIEHLRFSEAVDATHAATWKDLETEWRKLSGKLDDQKSTRNIAAHGVVHSVTTGGTTEPYITDVPMQIHTALQAFRNEKPYGKSLADALAAIPAIARRREQIDQFRQKLEQHLQERAVVTAQWHAEREARLPS